MSPLFDNFLATDRGCVGDQPQKRPNANRVHIGTVSPDGNLLRLIFDTAAVQFLLPAPAK